jgi:nicotinamidase-related amidase
MVSKLVIRADDMLLGIDIQCDFCWSGALAVPRGDEVVPVVNRIASRFAHFGLTQDWHPKGHISFASSHAGKKPLQKIVLPYGEQVLWPDHCVPGTKGAEFHPALDANRVEVIIRKGFNPTIDSYSAFYENDRRTSTGLGGYLRSRGIRRLFMAGLATDFCVQYSALDARREGFEVWVIEEAVRGIDIHDSLAAAWQTMHKAGVRLIHEQDLFPGPRGK